jgi:precorrin-6B methylase 2
MISIRCAQRISARIPDRASAADRTGDPMLTVTRYGITSRFDMSPWPEDDPPSLYRPFLNGKFYEQAFLDHIRGLKLRGVYVDAGSCLGTHTVWFAMYCPATYVHAFDPRERCARWTQMNVDANELTDKVTVHQVGLGAKRGQASSHLDGLWEHFDVVPLDKVVRGKVVVLKIDVEGMEEQVLKGARRILRRYHPVVFAEAFNEPERATIEAMLKRHRYRATGRVFNSTPTYEFVYEEPPLTRRLRRVAHQLPEPVRKVLRTVRGIIRSRRA